MIVICAILLVACGRKDPLNRQAAYFTITEGSSGEVYGVRETYRANTTVTRNQFLDQDEDVVKALKDYIENRLPKEKDRYPFIWGDASGRWLWVNSILSEFGG